MTKQKQMPKNTPTSPSVEVSSPSPPASAGGDVVRSHKGRFVAGKSGNPKGRPKGTRNKITVLRENLELALRDYMAKPAQKQRALAGIDRMFEIMESGDEKAAVAAFKAVFDKTLPQVREPEQKGESAQPTVEIVITNATNEKKVISGEYETIED